MVAEKYVRQVANLIADKYETAGDTMMAAFYRNGAYDNNNPVIAFAEHLEQQDKAQPTFEQRVEAMKRTYQSIYPTYEDAVEAYDRHLAAIMTPVDPLLEAVNEAFPHVNVEDLTEKLRKALADRGLEIREVQG